jgi:hypothetical protein
MTFFIDAANKIADSWGPAVTKIIKDKDMEPLLSLCAPSVAVVLQTSTGDEASFTIGGEGAIDWSEFADLTSKDMEKEDYKQTESASMGVLGNRMILEVGRINSKDELYMNACMVLTLDKSGKITTLEAFADSVAPSVLDAALAAEAADSVTLHSEPLKA